MKKVFVIVVIIIFSAMLVYLAFNNEPKQSAKIISVKKDYSYVYNNNTYLELALFINKVDQPLLYKDNYQSLYLESGDETHKLKVQLIDIVQKHQETYLNEKYNLYILQVLIPVLNESFIIDDAYLNIELINHESKLIKLGRISLYYISDQNNTKLTWENLSGFKNSEIKLSRIGTVSILFNDYINDILINNIKINEFTSLTYEINNNVLTINIPFEQYLLNQFSVIINYNDNINLVISNFPFVEDFEILNNSVSLISVYESS